MRPRRRHSALANLETTTHTPGERILTDAVKAVKMLHKLVEGTVSVFKDFEIKDGVLVPKPGALGSGS